MTSLPYFRPSEFSDSPFGKESACAGVGMLTPRSDWSSHMIASSITYILEVGSTRITIAPGKVSLFWPNESCT